MKTIQHFVGGKSFSGDSNRKSKVFNPATGEQSAEVKLASAKDVNKAVENAKKGQIRYKTDKAGIIHTTVGKVDFDPIKIEENIYHLIDDLNKAKPSSAKGKYMKNITISSTMGPGIKVDLATVERRS